jgi:HlyD family secretion protein
VNGDVSSLSSASNTIVSDANTLYNLQTGADTLAVEAGRISLAQAQQTYDNYFIRTPFSGTIGRIPATVYSQAGGSTVIATVVGDQKLANISLNEVDAANVKVGQKTSVTFDAISNFTATGTVSEVDQVGTVSGGVVSFGVKIAIDTVDSRILPGMSLNVTVITNELDGVTIVPSAAVKASGRQSYVQTLDPTIVKAYIQSQAAASGRTASTTRNFSASTTAGFGGNASSTRSFTGSFAGGGGTSGTGRASLSVTMPSATPPSSINVTVGQSDSTNIQILSGLTPGQWVVTRTIAGSSASTATAAPSLLSSLGAGARGGAAGAVGGGGARTTATPAATTRPAGN